MLGPVALGMMVRSLRPAFAAAMDKPVRIASVVILTLVIIGSVAAQIDILTAHFAAIAGVVVTFCLVSLGIGFLVPRLLKVDRPQSIASAFEVGLHNATLAIVIAQSVLRNADMSMPAAVYGVLMFPLAAAFGVLITRGSAKAQPSRSSE